MINKKKSIFLLLFFSLLSTVSYADVMESVALKIAVDEHHYLTLDFSKSTSDAKFLKRTVANLVSITFDFDGISNEFYSEYMFTKKENGGSFKVYKFEPLFNDRFSHVIWLYPNSIIYRHEVYDLYGKMLYSYTVNSDKNRNLPKKKVSRVHGGYYFYKGFKLVFSGKNRDGEKQLVFTDGLNSFSVFWKKSEKNIKTIKRIVLGNYMLRKKCDDKIFTVVGTIPFFEMEKIIKYLIEKEVVK